MFCTNCGKQIPDTSVFCPLCGAKILTAADNPDMNNPSAGAPNAANAGAFGGAPAGAQNANPAVSAQPVKAQAPAHGKKPNKKLIIILSCAAALVVVLAVAIPLIISGVKASKYEEALGLLNDQGYEEAAEIFTSLGDYEDAPYYAEYASNKASYNYAKTVMESGGYDTAEDIFISLGDFEDSSELAAECHSISAYEAAEECYYNEQFEDAYNYYTEAGDYKDAPDMAAICGYHMDYESALTYMENGDYDLARELLEGVDTYYIPEAEEKLEECVNELTYNEAYQEAAAGNNSAAYSLYSSLGDYKDAAQLAEQCTVEMPSTGETYHNSDYISSAVSLTIKPPKSDGSSTYFKVYTTDDVLVCSVFINAGDTAKIKLPAGEYIFKSAYSFGPWFGETDMFGDVGYYQVLKYDSSSNVFKLKKNYIYTLTLRSASEGNVATENTDKESF